ncbi:MAG: hypothetical protein KA100_06220 [Rickettsiales bacterium]|nr:hypothetical protein [Rickettsiales bacterium]
MSDDNHGPSSFEISNRIATHVGNGAHVGGGEGGETHPMLHIGKQEISIGTPGIDSALKLGASFESAWTWLKEGANALGGSITEVMGRISNYLGTSEAKGDTLELTNISLTEVTKDGAPGVSGDAQWKHASFRGSDGGQSAGM